MVIYVAWSRRVTFRRSTRDIKCPRAKNTITRRSLTARLSPYRRCCCRTFLHLARTRTCSGSSHTPLRAHEKRRSRGFVGREKVLEPSGMFFCIIITTFTTRQQDITYFINCLKNINKLQLLFDNN